MRSIRNATVSFGVISIDVGVCAATTSERDNISFSNLHATKPDGSPCLTPVKQPKMCPACDMSLEGTDLIKGYKVDKGQYVTFTNDEIEACEAGRSKFLTVTKFVTGLDARAILDHIKKSYYLEPMNGDASSYGAMVHAMEETEAVAIGHSSLWGKETPFALDGFNGVMGYHLLHPMSEVIHPDFTITKPDERYMTQAKLAISEWTEDLDPSVDLVSGPDILLRQMVQAKIAGEEFSASAVAEIPLPQVDLLEALKETMAAAPKRRKKVSA